MNLLTNHSIHLSAQVTEHRLKKAGVTMDHDALGIKNPKVPKNYRLPQSVVEKL